MPEPTGPCSMKNKKPHILFLLPYPLRQAPSQRFRVELFLPVLDKAGYTWHIQTFLDENTWRNLYRGTGFFRKAWGVIKGYARRWKIILSGLSQYDYIFIHREAAPLGPPLFEWIISRVFRKKIIYDFDDAIWIPNTSRENRWAAWFKAFWKVKHICRWAHKVVGGNDYLCEYARQYNANVIRIPTCVDTVHQHNVLKVQGSGKITIGWTGSHSTMKFLDPLLPVIRELEKEHDFNFLVISDKNPGYDLKSYRFLPWNESTEVTDLLQLHIGLMPLQEDPWCEGKCGFKLVQYLSLGIPALASPVGVNKSIVEHGISGYLCQTDTDWLKGLRNLLTDEPLRTSMGRAGRTRIEHDFSIASQTGPFLALFAGMPAPPHLSNPATPASSESQQGKDLL